MADIKLVRMKKNGVEYGCWRTYLPATSTMAGQHVNLATTDRDAAMRKAQELMAKRASYDAPTSVPPASQAPVMPSAPSTPAPGPTEPIDPRPLLNEWAGVPPEAPAAQAPATGEYQDPGPGPEEAKKTAAQKKAFRMLAKVAARLNVVAVGLSVKAFGRQPTEPNEDDIDDLGVAWETQLAELLENEAIPPWALILGISASMGLGMWMEGQPIPKKEKPNGAPGLPQ